MITHERADFIYETGRLRAFWNASSARSRREVRELLAKAREMQGLSMDEVACLSFVESPELLAGNLLDGKANQGRDLRNAAGLLCAALHLQPLRERVHLLRVSRDERRTQAPHADAGRDCGRDAHPYPPGTQARSDGFRRSVAAARAFNTFSTLSPQFTTRESAPAKSGAST